MALTLLSLVALAIIMGGFLFTTHATDTSDTTDENTTNTTATLNDNFGDVPPWNNIGRGFGEHGFRRGLKAGPGCGFGGFGAIEVSAEFEQKVISIAESDEDVQQLLDEGYNVTRIVPIVKTIIDGDGNVVTKATNATVTLEKDTTGRAIVSVDLEQEQVTQIIILTRTVIDKSSK